MNRESRVVKLRYREDELQLLSNSDQMMFFVLLRNKVNVILVDA